MRFVKGLWISGIAIGCILSLVSLASAQSVASGTIEGAVTDASGGVIVGAAVEIQNPITGFRQTTMTDAMGAFRFTNIPFNQYHLQVTQQGFATSAQDLNIRSTVPVTVKLMLSVAEVAQS